MDVKLTNRGFRLAEFSDRYGAKCSLQESSLAEPAIWLGVDDADPKVMVRQAPSLGVSIDGRTGEELNGWMPYPIPDGVLLTTRMHLTREQLGDLLPLLRHFVDTGRLPDDADLAQPIEEVDAELRAQGIEPDGVVAKLRRRLREMGLAPSQGGEA